MKVSSDQRRTVLSEEEDSKSRGAVEAMVASAFSGLMIDGENETLYTVAEWPMRRREVGNVSSVLTLDGRGSPLRFQRRIVESSQPTATILVSSENSMQVKLDNVQ